MVKAIDETIVVTQSAEKLVVDFTSKFMMKTTKRQVSYDLAGKPVPNEGAMGDKAQTVAKWADGKLVVTWTSEGAVAGSPTVKTETRWLSADGKEMSVETARANKPAMVLVYDKKKMKAATTLAVTGAVLAAAAGGWWAWSQAGADAESAAERRFVSPERRSVAATVLATGVVRLRVGGEVRVGAQLSGIVDKLNVEVGSKVKRGDIIATIDSKGLEARLAQARAQVAVMAQEVRRAEIELVRMQRLDEQKLVAANDVEDRALALDEARARLEKARRDAAVVETDLGYAVIRSPITGTVAAVTTQEGETVAASFTTPTFATIIEDGALELIAMVDETDIGNVVIDNPVRFTVEAYPAEEFEGHVVRIAPKGTIISGVVNFEVMIRIDSPAGLLKPDMTANVSDPHRRARSAGVAECSDSARPLRALRLSWSATVRCCASQSWQAPGMRALPRSFRASDPEIACWLEPLPADATGRQEGSPND